MSRFDYVITSKSGGQIRGIINYFPEEKWTPHARDIITQRILSNVAVYIQNHKLPWDPFNIELVVKAHPEPKPL